MTQADQGWKCQPQAESFLYERLNHCIENSHLIKKLAHDLETQTSSLLFDWLDHIMIGASAETEKKLEDLGFILDITTPECRSFFHPGAQLPYVVLHDQDPTVMGVAVSVESISDFLMVRGLNRFVEGTILSGYRRCLIDEENGISLWVIERRGDRSMEPIYRDERDIEKYLEYREKWQTRPRSLVDEEGSMKAALALAEEMVENVGRDKAAWIVLEVERFYWQAHNTAGQIQKNRQDRLGMGWANHDHHTFRSSREFFSDLVRLFEILGFHCRERFYAGEEAGWGAQIMENQNCGLVLFLDVDLAPHELEFDFAHQTMPAKKDLGTVGLWCALHGDSILKAGMHHLEAQFLFDNLKSDLGHLNIRMMDPFSDFPFLKQAFTAGEIWPVDKDRIQKLLHDGKITIDQAEKFLHYGAIGSHLENLQRREGYKGFNQKNVSFIIKRTDPRNF